MSAWGAIRARAIEAAALGVLRDPKSDEHTRMDARATLMSWNRERERDLALAGVQGRGFTSGPWAHDVATGRVLGHGRSRAV